MALSGVYHDVDAREYVILQDDVERLSHEAWRAHVRVLRQRHPYVLSGTVRVPAEVFHAIAPTDGERNSVMSSALVAWLQHRTMHVRFAVRATARREEGGRVSVRFEEATVQSS